ncbi:glycosyltransferase 87 family protein [Kribbella sp. CA-293567]|uniref:glycosyltransferase 87 family protein n=1 Tax=Kribbella sp. CA-293567 TaxID=3002436 RepID=UPI0022DCED0B|nr:glycosyltransferase 87 family protein [Kribbella sp. CA-293567]WBQ07984.1 glycosyltransferase 87 family protein [Kribbella sp. CA-293567]
MRLVWAGVVAVGVSAGVMAAQAAGWWPNLVLIVGCLVVGGAGWLLVRRPAGRHAVLGVVAVAAICQLPGLLSAPITSTDAYRYVWDGRVQLSGSSPYSQVPLADELAPLRDPVLFPGLSPADRSGVTGPPRVPRDPASVAALSEDDPRTKINRPRVPTIYPPVAQAYFTTVALLTPWSAGTLGLQVAAAALAVALTVLLAKELQRAGRDPRWALLWGWSPIVVLEAANAAHVDVLAALFVIAGVVLASRRRPALAGLLLGAAAATKLLPLLLLPAFTAVRRRELRTPLVAVGTFIASYLPHLLAAGTLVIGFLPGYLTQEGFSDGSSRSAILALALPPEARQLVSGLLAVALAVLALRRHGREPIAVTCCWLYGAALLLATPTYPWYGLPLIALAVLAGRFEWLAVPLAAYLAYAGFGHGTRQGLIYLAAAVIVVSVLTIRHRSIAPGRFDERIAARQH